MARLADIGLEGGVCVMAVATIQWLEDLDTALARARQEQKVVLADFLKLPG